MHRVQEVWAEHSPAIRSRAQPPTRCSTCLSEEIFWRARSLLGSTSSVAQKIGRSDLILSAMFADSVQCEQSNSSNRVKLASPLQKRPGRSPNIATSTD